MPERMNPAACWPIVLLSLAVVWAFRHEIEKAGYELLGTPKRERV